jgi:hypothetical protein
MGRATAEWDESEHEEIDFGKAILPKLPARRNTWIGCRPKGHADQGDHGSDGVQQEAGDQYSAGEVHAEGKES